MGPVSAALLKAIAPASKVAKALERQGPVLNLCIHRNRIDLGVKESKSKPSECGRHNNINIHGIDELDNSLTSIPTLERQISPLSVQRLQEVVDEHDVSAFVIAWPLHTDTGKIGASCGRVLYTIESMIQMSSSTNDPIFSSRRPVCLWHPYLASNNDNGYRSETIPPPPLPPPDDDEYGRCPLHARISHERLYNAAIERYHNDEDVYIEDVWKSFAEANWPRLVERQRMKRKDMLASATSESCSNNLISDWRDGGNTFILNAAA